MSLLLLLFSTDASHAAFCRVNEAKPLCICTFLSTQRICSFVPCFPPPPSPVFYHRKLIRLNLLIQQNKPFEGFGTGSGSLPRPISFIYPFFLFFFYKLNQKGEKVQRLYKNSRQDFLFGGRGSVIFLTWQGGQVVQIASSGSGTGRAVCCCCCCS